MSLTLTTDPKKTVNNLDSDVASTVQLLYEFKREDHEYTSIANDGGDVQIILAVGIGDVSSEFTIGDKLYLKEDADGYAAGIYSVTAVTFATNTKVTINLAYVATGTGYINLLTRVKHHLEANIYDSAGTTLLINYALTFAGTQAGVIKFDIGKSIRGYLKANSLQSIVYKLKWREAYIDLTPPALTSLDNVQAIDSILPLLHQGGSNMWDYLLHANLSLTVFNMIDNGDVTFDVSGGDLTQLFPAGSTLQFNSASEPTMPSGVYTVVSSVYVPAGIDSTQITLDFTFTGSTTGTINPDPEVLGKFLTKFNNPVLWDGWKREISYVVDSDYTARLTNAPHSLFRYLDQNRVFISNSDDTVRSATEGLYNLPLEVAAIPATAYFIDATITDDVTGANYTETLQFQILTECKNPIMIEWLNSLGHYEQHLFEMDQEINDSIAEGFEWQRSPIDDISTENNLIGRVEGELHQVITMADQDLTTNQIQALREIKSSPDVRLFLTKDGASYVNVTIAGQFDTLFNTDNNIHEMQLSIRLPKNFNFFDSKLY